MAIEFSERDVIPPCEHISIFTEDGLREINRIGKKSGCHTCGTKDPGTRSGNFIADIQPPGAINWGRRPQFVYPHCLACKRTQNTTVLSLILKNGCAPSGGIAQPGCMAFVADPSSRAGLSEVGPGGSVWATNDRIAFGMMSFMDGMTQVQFGPAKNLIRRDDPDIDTVIDTPGRRVAVLTYQNEIVGRLEATDVQTRIRIWTDHPVEPGHVEIAFGY